MGRELESGRDFHRLTAHLKSTAPGEKDLMVWKKARNRWEKFALVSWNFGTLPEQLSLGTNLVAYPGLEPEEDAVSIRLFANAEQALKSHKKGVKILFCLHLKKDLKFLKRVMVLSAEATSATTYFGGPRTFEKELYESLVHRLFYLDIRTEADFYGHAERVRPSLVSKAKEFMQQAERVLKAFHETRTTLQAIETSHTSNRAILALCAHIRDGLDRLVPQDFSQHYAMDRLVHLPRYLRALEIRAERGAYDVEKDKRKAVRVDVFLKALEELGRTLSPHSSREKRESLEEYRWMIEELKVSIFAPELKTPFPVSQKRLEKKVKEIRRMV
jgi:ATP-dependent helicase HrpA